MRDDLILALPEATRRETRLRSLLPIKVKDTAAEKKAWLYMGWLDFGIQKLSSQYERRSRGTSVWRAFFIWTINFFSEYRYYNYCSTLSPIHYWTHYRFSHTGPFLEWLARLAQLLSVLILAQRVGVYTAAKKKNNQLNPGLPEEKHSAFSFAQLRDELKWNTEDTYWPVTTSLWHCWVHWWLRAAHRWLKVGHAGPLLTKKLFRQNKFSESVSYTIYRILHILQQNPSQCLL